MILSFELSSNDLYNVVSFFAICDLKLLKLLCSSSLMDAACHITSRNVNNIVQSLEALAICLSRLLLY